MQRYTIFFIAVNALHVSGGFSAHHQELKTVHTASGICQACLLLPLPLHIITKIHCLPFCIFIWGWCKMTSCIPLSITNKMQRYTIFFTAVNALHVSGGFSGHHQELKTVHTASGIRQACLLLPLAWVSSNSPTLAAAASKPDISEMLCVQFWAPDDVRKNRLKHVEHWHCR
jgi:hypothetical protein